MLSNPVLFDQIEKICRSRGTIAQFEAENGEMKGRMMIDAISVPDDVPLKPGIDDRITAFEASFDFMDCRIGLAVCVPKMEAASGFWYSSDEGGQPPDQVWIEFFVQTLMESIEPDGSYGIPIYVFISDAGLFSVVPTTP